jgi:hypothetical protein
MTQRLLFLSIAGFFATMNVLLWRAEFGLGNRLGSVVPVEAVMRRVLTAPDDSSLEIRRDGERIGYCHWIAGAAEEMVLETAADMEGLPEGMVRKPGAYVVHLEGGILTGPVENRLRFNLELKLNEAREWRELVLRLGNRPTEWQLKAAVATRMVEVRQGPEGGGWSRQFTFEELDDPRQLAMELGGPALAALLAPMVQTPGVGEINVRLAWEARSDWMQVGGTRVQVFRLEAKLSNRHQISVLVSRVGEIMRVELPGGLTLVNEVLVNF